MLNVSKNCRKLFHDILCPRNNSINTYAHCKYTTADS